MKKLPVIFFLFFSLCSCEMKGQMQNLGSFEGRWMPLQQENLKIHLLKYVADKDSPIDQSMGLNKLIYTAIDEFQWQLIPSKIQIDKGWTKQIDPFAYQKGKFKPEGYSFEEYKIGVNDYQGTSLKQSIVLIDNELKLEFLSLGLISQNDQHPPENREISAFPEFVKKQVQYEDEEYNVIYRIELQVPLEEIDNGDTDLKLWLWDKYFGTPKEHVVFHQVECEKPMTQKEIEDKLIESRTIYITNTDTYENEPLTTSRAFDKSDIEMVSIVQNWYFSKSKRAIYVEPLAMSLLIAKDTYDRNEGAVIQEPIGWIKIKE